MAKIRATPDRGRKPAVAPASPNTSGNTGTKALRGAARAGSFFKGSTLPAQVLGNSGATARNAMDTGTHVAPATNCSVTPEAVQATGRKNWRGRGQAVPVDRGKPGQVQAPRP